MDENQPALGTEVATTVETDGAPETSGSQSNGGNYSEVYRNLEKKMRDNSHYEPTQEEWDAFEKVQKGEKPEEGETPETPEDGEKPEAEKVSVPDEILKKVGAKSIAELGPKLDGLLETLKEFNNERGATGSKIKEFETQKAGLEGALQNQHNLLLGVLNGDQRAIEQAQAIMGKAGIKVEAKAKAPDFSKYGINPEDLENAVDAPVIKGLLGVINKLESRLDGALSKADEAVSTITTKAAQDTAWSSVVNEFAEVGDKFFADKGLRASAVRQLMRQWKEDGTPPDAIKPLVELAQFADKEGVTLERAYKLREFDQLPQRLNRQGKAPIAKPTVGMSDKMGKAVQNDTHREFSGPQLEKIWKTGEFPSTWKTGDELDFSKIPEYAQSYFEEMVR